MSDINVAEIKSDASKHVAVCMCTLIAIVCLVRCGMAILKVSYSLAIGAPLMVGFVFGVVETIVVSMLWLRTATRNLDGMPTFHSAVSGFRVLAALAVLGVAYLVVGRQGMRPYVVWMGVFYVALLVLHTVFFSRENVKLYNSKKNTL